MTPSTEAQDHDRLPVSVITGFLGSGKTTLLAALLRHPGMDRTAAVINEFGEVGLDHHLIETGGEDLILMDSGCLCCTIRGDLVTTLRNLFLRRVRGEVPDFERVVIETTGLADPAPILHTLMSDPLLTARYRLDGVITVIDSVNGPFQLDSHIEAVKQAAVADRLVMTKTDLARDPASRADIERLTRRLTQLNPAAPLETAIQGAIEPESLFGAGLYNPATKQPDVAAWLRAEAYAGHDHAEDVNRHGTDIRAFCLYHDNPLEWQTVADWFELLTATRGENLLRIKGILNVAGQDRPVAIHGVQHLFHPPVALAEWPDADRRSRIVFITRNLGEEVVRRTLDGLTGGSDGAPASGTV